MMMMRPFSVNRGKHYVPDISQLEKEYVPTLQEDIQNQYNPFSLTQLQPYIPIYSSVLDIYPEEASNISLNNPLEFSTLTSVVKKDEDTEASFPKDVFIKFSPLLDPIKYMTGKYEKEMIRLPSISQETHPKIDNPHNASYVDGFFCYLSSKFMDHYKVPHCIGYYGSHLAFQRKFKMVMDELDYLMGCTYFINHVGKKFFISGDALSSYEYANNSRCNKPKLQLDNSGPNCEIEMEIDDIVEVVEVIPTDACTTVMTCTTVDTSADIVYANASGNTSHMSLATSCTSGSKSCTSGSSSSTSHNGSASSSDNSLLNYSTDNDSIGEEEDDSGEDQGEEEESGDDQDEEEEEEDSGGEDDQEEEESGDDEEEPELYSYINDFPVQMICLEKCVGTFDDLIMKGKIDEYTGASALFQIIMTLIIYQKVFHFTHNDLHTNNIMYVNTEEKYLYYNYLSTKYRVPTYGRIYKIIDFGRSIYEWNGRRFCSDSFQNGGDAATQYNCEPFFNEDKPRIDPNYSFDLCRLGASIYDFVIDENETPNDMDDFQKIIYKWCMDDNGKNILYKKNGEDRYPNFKLYKMIARTVHFHSPENQLDDNLFRDFKLTKAKWDKIQKDSEKDSEKEKIEVIDIDSMPFLG